MHVLRAAAVVLAAAAGADAVAGTAPAPAWRGGSLTVISENDKWAFRGADQHYTNGIRLGWISDEIRADDDPGLGWARRLAAVLPGLQPGGRLRVGVALGQNIYTPSDTRRTIRDPADRPYAGWLYGGFALINEVPRDGGRAHDVIETIEVNVGLVGPDAGGERVQNRWHGLIGVEPARGWSTQVPNEPGFALFYERKWRNLFALPLASLDEAGIDVIPHTAFSLGNVATYVAGGATLRVGRNLDIDHGPPRIRPALSGSGFQHRGDGLGGYGFVGVEARLVGYDMFLDGPLFRDGPRVDRRPLVVDAQAGLAVTWGRTRTAFTYVWRTREFDSQPIADRFGALSLTIGF